MKLLGHTSPDMTMHYVDVTLIDLQREFQLARSQPRHLAPQPKISPAPLRAGLDGLIGSLLATQHVMEMVRRSLNREQRTRLNRLVNRLTKVLSEAGKHKNQLKKKAEIGRLYQRCAGWSHLSRSRSLKLTLNC